MAHRKEAKASIDLDQAPRLARSSPLRKRNEEIEIETTMENAGLPISMDAPPEWICSILKHGDLKTCMNLTTLSKSYHDELSTSCMWWKTACLKLAEERNLYFDTSYFESVSPSLESWKKVYEELWEMREQFNPEPEPEAKKPIWRMIMDGDEIPRATVKRRRRRRTRATEPSPLASASDSSPSRGRGEDPRTMAREADSARSSYPCTSACL